MTKHRILIALLAVVGAVVGAGIGAIALASPSRYNASANVALLPAPNLTTVEASDFWEVLTRGQVTRTAAIVYGDPRWLTPAAAAAEVPRGELGLTAVALPETTMLTVTVSAASAEGAESALNSVLTTATAEVTSLVAPYSVKVLWPPERSGWAEPTPGRLQMTVAGALGGLLIGIGIGWWLHRRRAEVEPAGRHSISNGTVDGAVDGSARGAPRGS